MRWLRRVSSQGEPRESRGWIDDPLSVALPGIERDRTNSPGLSLHVRPGGRQKSGAATAGVHALRAGRLLTFFVMRPRHKKETQDETVDHALHHILCRHT